MITYYGRLFFLSPWDWVSRLTLCGLFIFSLTACAIDASLTETESPSLTTPTDPGYKVKLDFAKSSDIISEGSETHTQQMLLTLDQASPVDIQSPIKC